VKSGFAYIAGLYERQEMPRPKPKYPLKPRSLRLSDEEWQRLKEFGGADWLRKLLGSRPKRYHEVFK